MTKKTEKAETQTAEKNKLIGRLSYLPYGARGYGTSIGPVFSTSNPDCEQVVVESIPLDLIRDIHSGQVGGTQRERGGGRVSAPSAFRRMQP